MSEQIKISHAFRILSSMARMKQNEFICDFVVKVAGKSFPTHRTILAASSDYFEGLFSSKMKESAQGYVDVKGVGVKGVQQSLEFMYTGEASITLESVAGILHAADLFQLDGLKNLCLQYLAKNLCPTNCLFVANLAQEFNHQNLKDEAEQVVVANLSIVMSSDTFPLIDKSHLLNYVSKVDHKTSWKAAVAWSKDKDQFSHVVEAMDINKIPFKFLLETVLEEPLVKQSRSVKKKVVKKLFSDSRELEKNLGTENCILLKTLAQEHGADDQSVKVITQFIEKNFEKVMSHPNFVNISKGDILSILESPATQFSSEAVKWEAGLKWVKHDMQQRTEVFPKIFRTIKLEKLSSKFLRDHIRCESLVKESRECSNILMDIFAAKSVEMEDRLERANARTPAENDSEYTFSSSDEEEYIEGRQPNGNMTRKILPFGLPGYSCSTVIEITYYFAAGRSTEGFLYSETTFEAYLPNSAQGNNLYFRLRKAFDAGRVFKLMYVPGSMRGEIICNIPHKKSLTGGRENDGYPDFGYLDLLQASLAGKGF